MRLDSKSEALLKNIYPEVARRSKRAIDRVFNDTGMEMKVSDGMRTYKKQNELYLQEQKVTDALPGLSYHNYGMAVDCCFMGINPYLDRRQEPDDEKSPYLIPKKRQDELWALWGRAVEDNGLRWGGRFPKPDQPHANIFASLSVREMKQILEKGGVRAVWSAVDWLLGKSGDEWNSPNSTYLPLDPRADQGGSNVP